MAEQASAGFGENTLKLLTFAGPVFASALAVTYDVGFFTGIGISFFSFFSLSEHLVFALQALPLASVPVAIFLLWVAGGWYGYKLGINLSETEIKPSKIDASVIRFTEYIKSRPWLQRAYVLITVLLIFLNVKVGQFVLGFMMLCSLLFAVWAGEFLAEWKRRSPSVIIASAVAVLILSFMTGLQRAHSVLESESASETIGTENSSLPARLIRGGDKGVLFLSLESKKVRFLRWDAIKQIETL
jgi:hypothetical protein